MKAPSINLHCYEVRQKIPDRLVQAKSSLDLPQTNLSLKRVKRLDSLSSGGYYRSSDNLVVVEGRPEKIMKDFATVEANRLPNDVPEDCKPYDDSPVDYIKWA